MEIQGHQLLNCRRGGVDGLLVLDQLAALFFSRLLVLTEGNLLAVDLAVIGLSLLAKERANLRSRHANLSEKVTLETNLGGLKWFALGLSLMALSGSLSLHFTLHLAVLSQVGPVKFDVSPCM